MPKFKTLLLSSLLGVVFFKNASGQEMREVTFLKALDDTLMGMPVPRDTLVTIHLKNVRIQDAMDTISIYGLYVFAFDTSDIKLAKNVTLNMKNVPIKKVLEKLIKIEYMFDFDVKNEMVLIRHKEDTY